ncbi:hypothetical protein Bhyg_11045 [Pseudolycoriella hygida]|uniref:Uncharacterized protein n=1 Tax=Pseudolycoriella hygida TaxID=35572 RepID=A0A9Q0RXZ0_9DIPT|nr:hypothetical protein Bhyg_11045 [Pseudolycoriella hygida]
MAVDDQTKLTNSTSPVPAPTSPFLSGAPPGTRRYAKRSSPVLEASPERAIVVGRGRAVSWRVARFNVDGTISGAVLAASDLPKVNFSSAKTGDSKASVQNSDKA